MRGAVLGAVLLAAALRFPALAARPMHADEAVHADKLGTLVEGGGYAYDPSEHHGPTLYYLTLLPARLEGARRYVDLDEATLRAVPAALGTALVAAHVLARGFLGPWGAAAAALLAALSPAMVFYSRYFIHETPLVLFSFGALLAAVAYLRRPGSGPALVAGASAGLMLATKETAPIALVSMLAAFGLAHAVDRWRGEDARRIGDVVRGRHVLLALAAAVVVAVVFFSSLFSHPRGVVDGVRSYWLYLDRANAASWHFHPWHYYLGLLVHFPASGTPVWTEALVLVLAVAGAVAGWVRGAEPPADATVLRFLTFYTLLMVVIYSAIPYKTPWCLLGFLHGMILLAGAGAVWLVRSCRGAAARGVLAALLLAGAAHLGWQAWSGSFRFPADPRNPYVYAHTSTDVFTIVDRLNELARAHPDGLGMPLQVVSRENLWPLPWYLRRFTRVEWWNGVSDQARSAPVIVITPDLEDALVRRLYDLPPPGERELYVSAFERPVQLRPGVELRGYAANGLWEALRQREAGPPPAGNARP
jgi:uncharacterized protein (TIGR03663 family)